MTTSNLGVPRGLVINKGLPRQLFNRTVTAVLHSPAHGVFGLDRFSMVLTYTGRKSGTSYSLPLAYTRDGDTITTFALFTNTVWWKNLRGGAPVTLRLRGRDYAGVAQVIEDTDQVAEGLIAFAAHAPNTRGGYYSLPRTANGEIDQAAVREAARTRVLIRVDLTKGTSGRTLSPRAKRLFRAMTAAHVWVYRVTRGRVAGRIGSVRVLLLTTTGRRSGKQITMPLNYVADGNRLVVVGAVGGAPHDPAWVHNIRANARVLVQTGGRVGARRAYVAEGAERERLWTMLTTNFPAFEQMQARTTRQFPLVVLAEDTTEV